MTNADKTNYRLPFILVTGLFFMWGFAHNLNPILIPHLKKACQLTDFQSALIDSSFFLAYFFMAIPAGMAMKKYGYKSGILIGLFLFAIGAFLFIPAANARVFIYFLTALFVIASGLTFLETAANPYISQLGPPEGAARRLNFAQSFNGLAASVAPFLGGLFILSGKSLSENDKITMSADQLSAFLNHEAEAVRIPYFIIGLVVLVVALLVYKINLPEIQPVEAEASVFKEKIDIWNYPHLMYGVVTQFFYVGAQVCVSSFFIRYVYKSAGIPEKPAAIWLSVALFGFMAGRFIGTALMRYIAANRLLALYSAINIVLLLIVVLMGGKISVFALMGVEFFMSIMFPTIFSLSIQNLGEQTKLGSSLVIMSIVGGAVLPLMMGRLSDLTNIQTAYIIPCACFLVTLFFALSGHKLRAAKTEPVAAPFL